MTYTRSEMLAELRVGDIVQAGRRYICLVTLIDEHHIYTRTVTTNIDLHFRRSDGVEVSDVGLKCFIDSVAPLDADLYQTFLGIDRKYRLEQETERLRLTKAEKHALVYAAGYYEANKLPPPDGVER